MAAACSFSYALKAVPSTIHDRVNLVQRQAVASGVPQSRGSGLLPIYLRNVSGAN